MDILTQMCNWWWLAWLLPFVLGLALGWALWAKYKKMKEDLEDELSQTKAKLGETEEDLERCKAHSTDLDSQIALYKGRLREAQYELEDLKKAKSSESKSKIASVAAGTKSIATKDHKKKESTKKAKPSKTEDKKGSGDDSKEKADETISVAKAVSASGIAAGLTANAKEKQSAKRGRPKKSEAKDEKPKAKRGRPKKTEAKDAKPKAKRGRPKKEETKDDKPKAKRGRPKGSKNVVKTTPVASGTKKRGRPKKEESKEATPVTKTPAKRGRPKGSTTKSKATSEKTATTKRRGRPKGSTNKTTAVKTAGASRTRTTRSKGPGVYGALKAQNLQVIEGIGPKAEEALKKAGIKTWRGLSSKTPTQLKDILTKSGGSFGPVDTSDWPRQAKLATNGSWTRLVNLQKELGGDSKSGETDSKVEKILIKMGALKKYRKDDLKAIEGVGPKIEQLLKKAGLDTWEKVSKAKKAQLDKVLSEAGSRFSLADPSTWAKQAGLAAKGKWDELKSLQDSLDGGRKKS